MEKRLKISDIKVEGRVRKDFGDISRLAHSIKNVGLLHAIGVTKKDHRLIFGERRLKAVQMNGDTEIDCRILDIDNIMAAEEAENEIRKDLTLSERHALARMIEEEIAKKNPRGAPKGNKNAKSSKEEKNNYQQNVDDCPESNNGESKRTKQRKRTSAFKTASQAGFGSEREMDRVSQVMEKGTPELIEEMDKGNIKPTAAAQVAQKTKEEQNEFLESHRDKETGRIRPKGLAKSQAVIFKERMRDLTARVWGIYETEEGKGFGGVKGMMESSQWASATPAEKRSCVRATITAAKELSKLAKDMEKYYHEHLDNEEDTDEEDE